MGDGLIGLVGVGLVLAADALAAGLELSAAGTAVGVSPPRRALTTTAIRLTSATSTSTTTARRTQYVRSGSGPTGWSTPLMQ